jgi:hypothetical protein
MAGKPLADQGTKRVLGGEVGGRHEIDAAFLPDVQVAAEILPVNPSARQRAFDGRGEVE